MLNSCNFQGRFAADPEMRTTQTDKLDDLDDLPF